jgi:peptide/nickel transport system substrate-binding protein
MGLLAACAAPVAAPPSTADTDAVGATPAAETAAMPADPWYTAAELTYSWINICTDTPPQYGGTLISAGEDRAMTTNTWFDASPTNQYLFSQLVDLSTELEIVPDVAERWEGNADNTGYTFYLRQDVTFHDGQPLTAADVKFSLEMLYHEDVGSGITGLIPLAKIEGAAAIDAGSADEMSGLVVVDDYTLQINFTEPVYNLVDSIGAFNIWPQHLLADIPFAQLRDSEYAKKPVGSGPFRMGEFVPEQYYVFEAFDGYFKGRPYLDSIVFRIGMTDSVAWIAALEKGEIHVGGTILGADRERLRENPAIRLVGAAIPGAFSIWPNTERLDKRVRQALMYALDRQAIVDGIFYGGTQATVWEYKSADPKGEWVGPETPEFPYDPERARALLSEAGWDANQELAFVSYYTRDTDQAAQAAMQQYWADAGIKVRIETMDSGTWGTRVYEQADFDLAQGCCGPANWIEFQQWYSCDTLYPDGWNAPRYCNAEVDNLVNAAVSEADPQQRQTLLHQATVMAADDLMTMGLWSENRMTAVRGEVCNFRSRQWAEPFPAMLPETWYLAGQ